MGLRDLLGLPRKHRRARSEARREANPVEATRVDLAALPHSQPNLRIESPISPTPIPSTSQNREPSGTCKGVLGETHLTSFPRKSDNATNDPAQSVTGTEHDKRSKPSEHAVKPSATHENGSNRKPTAYSTTNLAINVVEESADAFPPLKSVVGSLSAILDHCDVWFIFLMTPPVVLTAVPANGGVPRNNRIAYASYQRAGRITECACS